ncbi:right-handed parallel beta-helix repeat-containing protein [Mucilaginibacter daejeonensis]|uniref:right-handed parallel beta-helix repeat-containing protein n=1 Tax=Mucilaginibacter daejeonensis TaxID=398049 RepID=UPI001D17AC9B|nr:right-handed parallel beta-helix repeat-containing protein [Mucilaginibacter daejeonensis]UEG52191.1 right-handed parallel beta-helix repeat-containing protein [Mucilaginibacter daejeonensis]
MKTLRPFLAALGLLAFIFTGCEKANIDVDTTSADGSATGEVSGVWAKGSTQVIKGDIIIPAGKSLTIEEGVTVLMDTLAKPEIIVKGNLYSLGTAQNPVRFTVNEFYKTDAKRFGKLWGGILASPTCQELVLDHTILEYGGNTTSDASTSVKQGLYKAVAGENLPALWFANVNGKLIVTNSVFRNFQEDCTYIEGGKIIFANNVFYTTGLTGGEAMNFKSGCVADVAYNLIYSTNTNALKLSNSGDRTPQAYIVAYNNTMVNTGWRRPTAKGGSVWVESTVRAELYNNLFLNTRFGVKRDTKKPEDSRSIFKNNWYYGYDQTTVNQFQPSSDVIGGVNDVISKVAGDNDPKLVNYPLNTPTNTSTFNTAWDFHLQAGSPALTKGITTFTRNHANGIIANGVSYASPAPSAYVGAFGTK